MNFEILGEISDIETIAIGRSIRELERLQKAGARDAIYRVSTKELPLSNWKIEQYVKRKFIGTKPTELVKKKSRLSIFWDK